jgi:hypothetical protein
VRLFEELFQGEELKGEHFLPKIVVLPSEGAYVEGVKSVGDFTKEKLVLYFSNKHCSSVEIAGENFTIAKLCEGDLCLKGDIVSIRFPQNERETRAKYNAKNGEEKA